MKQSPEPFEIKTCPISVSVIIAVYNGEHCISRAIDSVINQTCQANEIIVVNDGSTDQTSTFVKDNYPDIILIDQPNCGVSAARNKGVNRATSEWIMFLDADDWYYPVRVESHVTMLKRHPTLDFLTGDFDYIGTDQRRLRGSMESTPAGRIIMESQPGDDQYVMQGPLMGEFVASHFGDTHTLTVRKRDFIELGGYPVNYKVCEDVHFLSRLVIKSKKAGVYCKAIAAYYIHESSATRKAPIVAQNQTVAAMESLNRNFSTTEGYLRTGYIASLRHARLDLAYAHLKQKNRMMAFRAILPLWRYPGKKNYRAILSIMKNLY